MIKSRVVDVNGTPVPATISLVDETGNSIKVVGIADGNGNFSVPDNAVDYWDDVYVEVSAIDRKSQAFFPEKVPAVITMEIDAQVTEGAVVTGVRKKAPIPKKVNYILPAALGTLALISIGMFISKSI